MSSAMKVLEMQQGEPAWDHARFTGEFKGVRRCTASEAPVMMGAANKYCTRDELLRMKATGDEKEFSSWVRDVLFAKGHKAEADARKIVEDVIEDDLYPVTGVSIEYDFLLASYDGLTMMREIGYEHKLWNEELAEQVSNKQLDPLYEWQLEQQLLVSGAEKIIFVVSDGTKENYESMEYYPKPGYADKLLKGWALFLEDLEKYVPPEPVEEMKAKVVESLPVISYTMDGLALTSNLSVYKSAAEKLVEDSKKLIETDQDFFDRDLLNKTFGTAEGKIKMIQEQVLNEAADIAKFTRELGDIGELLRQARLNGEKQVTNRKKEIRNEIAHTARVAWEEHLAGLNKRTGKITMPLVRVDFAGEMKNKRTIESLRNAVNTELARVKLEANEIADKITSNTEALREATAGFEFLFHDVQQIIMKDQEDLLNLAKMRITDHKAAEQKKIDDAAAEQKRIDDEAEQKRIDDEAKLLAASTDETESDVPEEEEKAPECAESAPEPAKQETSNVATMPLRTQHNLVGVPGEPKTMMQEIASWSEAYRIPQEAVDELVQILEQHAPEASNK